MQKKSPKDGKSGSPKVRQKPEVEIPKAIGTKSEEDLSAIGTLK